MTNNDYETFLKNAGFSEYTIDGAINPAIWASSTPRILFYLKENYGYEGHGVIRIADYAHQWLRDGIKTYKKIVLLSAAVREALRLGRELTHEEIDALLTDESRMFTELDRIAVVNIKKTSGESTSNDTEIRTASQAIAPLLKMQIESLAPTVIVACGTVCWDSLIWDTGLFEAPIELNRNESKKVGNYLLCRTYHPAARGSDDFDIHTIHSSIFHYLK